MREARAMGNKKTREGRIRAAACISALTLLLTLLSGIRCQAAAYGEFLLTGELELNNKDFSLFIHADHTSGVRGGEGCIEFNPRQLKVTSLNLSMPQGFDIRYSLEDGKLRFIFWGEDELSGSVILFSANFEVLSGNQEDTVDVKLTEGVITDGYTDTPFPDASYSGVLKTVVTAPPTTEPVGTEPITDTQTDSETQSAAPPETTDTETEDTTGKNTGTETDIATASGAETDTENRADTTVSDPPAGRRGAVVWILLAVVLTAAVLTAVYLYIKSGKSGKSGAA